MLDLAGDAGILEATDQRTQLSIVHRIQRVQNGLGQSACLVQSGQKLGDVAAAGVLGDSVHTGVGTLCLKDPLIVVTQAGVVQLHSDVQTGVGLAQVQQDHSLEAFHFLGGELFALQCLLVYGICLLYGVILEGNIVQAVVAGLAATGVEVLQALSEGIQHICHGGKALLANGSGQLFHIFLPAGLVDVHGLVGTVGGADYNIKGLVSGDLFVPLQIIDGIVGGADKCYICLLDQAAGRHLGIVLQLVVADLPNSGSALGGERLIHAEELLQFQVTPVVHRIADGHFQSLSQLQETLVGRLVAGDIAFVNAVGTHQTPLVVVAGERTVGVLTAQPYFNDVVETAILIDLLGVQMAVIVHQGHLFCVIVEQMLGGFGFQQEILVHKCFHTHSPCNLVKLEGSADISFVGGSGGACIHAGYQSQHSVQSNQGGCTVADKGQGQTDNRANAGAHTHIDQCLENQCSSSAEADHTPGVVLAAQTNPNAPGDDAADEQQHCHTTHIAQFLADGREDKVCMLTGKNAVLRTVTIEQALAGHTTAGERFQRQIGLPPNAGTGCVQRGVKQDFNAKPLISVEICPNDGEYQSHTAAGHGKPNPAQAAGEDHDCENKDKDGANTQVAGKNKACDEQKTQVKYHSEDRTYGG